MNFKEQMQEKAEIAYRATVYADRKVMWHRASESASQAALTSDLVKGLVDALENLLTHNADLLRTVKNHGAFVNTWLNGIEAAHHDAKKILTNYKQEVKQ